MFVTDGSRDQSHDRIGDNGGCQFATRQHVIAYRYLFGDQMLPDAVVYTFIMTAQNNHIIQQRHAVRHRLVECFPVRRRIDYLVILPFAFQSGDSPVDRFDLHHHPGLTTERVIVYTAPFVSRVVTQVM